MVDFFRFPHTPHIDWLGDGTPRDDKVLSPPVVDRLLAGKVLVEEKLDGANLGISINSDGELRAQNRGQYLVEPFGGQFSRLTGWLVQHENSLKQHLSTDWILFGEWCAAKHSLGYNQLPDWFLIFDVYDRKKECFFSCRRRDELAEKLGLVSVPRLFEGQISLSGLKQLLSSASSYYRQGAPEGLIIRRDKGLCCEHRAKLVRADFAQSIEAHWSRRLLEWNQIKYG